MNVFYERDVKMTGIFQSKPNNLKQQTKMN